MTVTINGTTGITTPAIDNQGNLTVDGGTIKLDGNYPVGANNVALGDAALASGSLSGGDNTAVGFQALTTNTSGAINTAVGSDALRYNTTGGHNTSLGVNALKQNTSGNYHTAVGKSALESNTTADSNNAFGRNALFTNTTGAQNVALGYLALYLNTTASYNTAVGNQALQNNTTGANNTSLGFLSLYANTTGSQNVALGTDALQQNTTASKNTAVGYQAGYANTTGDRNTAVGYQAGDALTTGLANVLIGHLAGTHSTDLTTGGDNVIVGSYSRTTASDTSGANVFGYDVAGVAGYTTLGNATNDIRAAHGNVTWATVSDERYKKDIVNSAAGLSFINALQPRTFKYKTLGELPETFSAYKEGSTQVFKNSNTNHGFIAQEIKAAIDLHPEIKDGFRLWDEREDGGQEVAEAALIPVLVKAIQELSAKNDALTDRITALEGN